MSSSDSGSNPKSTEASSLNRSNGESATPNQDAVGIRNNDSHLSKKGAVDGSAKPIKNDKGKRKRVRSLPSRIAILAIKTILVAYLAIIVFLLFYENRMVYPGAYQERSNVTVSRPVDLQLVSVKSTGTIDLPCLLLDRSGAANVVLFFHGNASRAAQLGGLARQLSSSLDASVMLAEYRGFEDENEPSERGVLDDCFAARDFLCDRYAIRPDQVILYGRSMGGGCAVAVASRGGAKALVLESTFDRMVDVAADRFAFIPVKLLMKNRYDSIARLTVYDGPLIQVHGTSDQVIPLAHGKRLFDSAQCEPKQWLEVAGMGHNDSLPKQTELEIASFIKDLPSDTNPSHQ